MDLSEPGSTSWTPDPAMPPVGAPPLWGSPPGPPTGPPPGQWPAPPSPAAPAPAPGATRPRRSRRAATLAAAAGISLLAGTTGGWIAGHEGASSARTTVAVDRASLTLTGRTLDVAAVVDAVKSSVVSIETEVEVRQGPFAQRGQGAGTGIVYDNAGLILTNAHVIEGATSVTVTASGDRTARTATIVASDPGADLALLRVSRTTGLVPATLSAAGQVQVGDDVVAIGNALALEGGLTVTRGIVSAVDRKIDTSSGSLSGLIQTDAAISSGNSGGALVDARGQVVGVNTAVATSSGSVSASNIGFAIDIHTAQKVVKQMTAGR